MAQQCPYNVHLLPFVQLRSLPLPAHLFILGAYLSWDIFVEDFLEDGIVAVFHLGFADLIDHLCSALLDPPPPSKVCPSKSCPSVLHQNWPSPVIQ